MPPKKAGKAKAAADRLEHSSTNDSRKLDTPQTVENVISSAATRTEANEMTSYGAQDSVSNTDSRVNKDTHTNDLSENDGSIVASAPEITTTAPKPAPVFAAVAPVTTTHWEGVMCAYLASHPLLGAPVSVDLASAPDLIGDSNTCQVKWGSFKPTVNLQQNLSFPTRSENGHVAATNSMSDVFGHGDIKFGDFVDPAMPMNLQELFPTEASQQCFNVGHKIGSLRWWGLCESIAPALIRAKQAKEQEERDRKAKEVQEALEARLRAQAEIEQRAKEEQARLQRLIAFEQQQKLQAAQQSRSEYYPERESDRGGNRSHLRSHDLSAGYARDERRGGFDMARLGHGGSGDGRDPRPNDRSKEYKQDDNNHAVSVPDRGAKYRRADYYNGDRDVSRYRDQDRDKNRHRDQDRDRDRSRDRDQDRDVSRYRDQDRDRDMNRHRDQDRDMNRHRDQDRDRDRSRDRDQDRDVSRYRDQDRDRDMNRHRDQDRDMNRHRDQDRDRDRSRDRDQDRDMNRHKDQDRDRARHSDRDNRDRDIENGRERDEHRGMSFARGSHAAAGRPKGRDSASDKYKPHSLQPSHSKQVRGTHSEGPKWQKRSGDKGK